MKRRLVSIVFFFLWINCAYGAESLKKVVLDDEKFLLLDVVIDRQTIASTVDAYRFDERVIIAIEPLFDSLKLRYQLTDTQLTVWKDDIEYNFVLSDQILTAELIANDSSAVWARDGYYQFIELGLLEAVFGVEIETDLSRQVVTVVNNTTQLINNVQPTYLFPVQKLALISERRQSNRFYNTAAFYEEVKNAITIADQYSLITPPSGRVNLAVNLADQSFSGSFQLVSDFLYHSANLTLSKTDNSDLATSLTLSRYKSSPNERIFGLFDSYRLGDVSGVSNNLTTGSNSGIGITFQRSPDDFRRKNLEVTLDELAPPGWDAELFRSGVFLDRRVVPDDGRLIYEDVELFYGLNDFEIRLYGPFGEEDIISNRINVKQNALAKGQTAYSINALDKNHRMFNDDNNEPYKITNFGGSFDVGITDRWQLGVAFASIDSEKQFVSMKNALSFNNFLFENDLSVNQDGSYAQLSSVTGSLFNKDNYTLQFKSAKDFESDIISAENDDYSSFSANYSLPTFFGLTRFGAGVQKTDSSKSRFLSNQLSTRIGIYSLTHNLRYSKFDLLNQKTNPTTIDSILGNLGVSASIPYFSVSATLNYDPEESDPILKSSSIKVRKTLTDPFENKHYFQAQYFPLSDVGRRWAIRHSIGWLSEDYQLTYSSSYDSADNWAVNLGLRFFLGYDHRNKRFIMDKEFSGGSATLDVHTYLDRQLNGVPDVLDYNLPDVTFRGNQRWNNFRSNEQGRTILPGVYANSEFPFAAKWQEGSATHNQNYVVYTHPGAYVDVNMPFYLITDLTGFVVRQQSGQEIALRNVQVQLFDAKNQLLQTYETDQDGYYEFVNLVPNVFTVRVKQDYLRNKGFTGDVIGIKVATSGKGGFVELPTLVLQRIGNAEEYRDETLTTFILNEGNVDALVWDNDKKIDRNYFTLPRKEKNKLSAPYSLTQANPQTKLQTVVELSKKIGPKNRMSVESTVVDMPTDEVDVNIKESPLDKVDGVLTRHRVRQKVENIATTLPNIKFQRPVQPLLQSVDTVNVVSNVVTQRFNVLQSTQNTGWIIQFSANRQPINNAFEIEKYSKIGTLYVAQKVNGIGDVYNCVLSQIYTSKQGATQALSNSGLSGWVINSENYSDFKEIN